jgi:hypothetical protein
MSKLKEYADDNPREARSWTDGDAIRLFTSPDGWVAAFTGSDIASRFPPLGEPAS